MRRKKTRNAVVDGANREDDASRGHTRRIESHGFRTHPRRGGCSHRGALTPSGGRTKWCCVSTAERGACAREGRLWAGQGDGRRAQEGEIGVGSRSGVGNHRASESETDNRAMPERCGRARRYRSNPNHRVMGDVLSQGLQKHAAKRGGAKRREDVRDQQDKRKRKVAPGMPESGTAHSEDPHGELDLS